MNPENKNPFSNTGTSSGASNSGSFDLNPVDLHSGLPTTPSADLTIPSSDQTLSAEDNLAMAGNELHSMAMHGADLTDSLTNDTTSLSSNDHSLSPSSNSSAIPSPTPEIPLTPAAPVPGSIGSAMSAPSIPKATPPVASVPTTSSMPPIPTAKSASSATTSAPTATSPASTATSSPAGFTPYNPFAQPAQPASTTATPASPAQSATTANNLASATNPSASTASNFPNATTVKAKTPPSKAMLFMIIGLIVSLMVNLILAILYIYAINHPRIVTVAPPTDKGEVSQNEVKEISCVLGTEGTPDSAVVTLNYTGDQLKLLSYSSSASRASEEEANNERESRETHRRDTLNLAGLNAEPYDLIAFTTASDPINNIYTVNTEVTVSADQLTSAEINSDVKQDTANLIGLTTATDGTVDTSQSAMRASYERLGYVCSE